MKMHGKGICTQTTDTTYFHLESLDIPRHALLLYAARKCSLSDKSKGYQTTKISFSLRPIVFTIKHEETLKKQQ